MYYSSFTVCFACVCLVVVNSVGCGGSTDYTPSRPTTEVMSESHRQDVVDQMVRQGADRTEADAFTRTLNELQREHEASR